MNPNDPLDELLASWQAPAHTPPDFHREIWRRIAQAPSAGRAAWLAWWLLQPRHAVLAAAAVVALAAAWGLTHPAEPEVSPHDAYVISISPFDALPQ